MNTRPFSRFALFLIISAAAVAASGEDIQHSLTDEYKGRILALRHPFKGTDQQYDVSGNVLSSNSEGPWTVFGRIRIEEIHVESTRLRIKGTRLQYQFDQQTKDLVPVPTKEHLKLDIALAKPLSSETEADSTLASVFALTDQAVLDTAPQFWVQYLSSHLASTTSDKPKQSSSAKEATRPLSDGKIHRVGEKEVTAPKPIYTPEPEFTDFARKAHYQGTLTMSTVIGPDGLPRKVSIVRPLGMGLDENAVAAVSTWRFQPATLNGEPVPV